MIFRKIIKLSVIALFFLILSAAGAYFHISAEIRKPLDNLGIYKNFKISQGEGINQIGENLAGEELIKNSFYFKLYVWAKGAAKSIKAGEYNLSGEMNIPEIVDIITAGRVTDREVTVMIPEGLTAQEIENILIGRKLVKEKEFVSAAKSEKIKKYYASFDFFGGKPESAGLEGYLFPDTYKFYVDAKPEEITRKMLDNFSEKFDAEMRLEANRQKKSIFEILTLASIVQEEASNPNDMKIIAGIFQNRLAIGKALEADSTINFITGKKMRQALFSDLEIDSPYNTYKYKGLPPTPISNPGESAIRAAIYPKNSNYWYYLSAKDGTTIFSRTLEEHNSAVKKYLK